MPAVDISSITYAYFFVGTAIAYGIGKIFMHAISSIVNKALEPICFDLQKIKYQVYNNGGESMKDSIDRIERDVVDLKLNQAVIKTKLEV